MMPFVLTIIALLPNQPCSEPYFVYADLINVLVGVISQCCHVLIVSLNS